MSWPGRGVASAAGATALGWTTAHLLSPAVRRWRPSTIPGRRYGPLFARAAGGAGTPIVLLHGLVSTGQVFGADFDALATRGPLIVPDLLGFGGSLDESRVDFGPETHLDALDELLVTLGVSDRPVIIGAHSMGAGLAVRWAARHPDRLGRLVCWGAPIYRSEADARATISAAGLMARLFVLDTEWAHRACALSCRHRAAAGWATAMCEPELPVPISRTMPLHTWPAYREAIAGLVMATEWSQLLPAIAQQSELSLVWGTEDRIGDRDFAADLTPDSVGLEPGADHHLPLSHGARCRDDLIGRGSDLFPRISLPVS
jgi:pimeloyl-ACP methyl ester carboxylesterase